MPSYAIQRAFSGGELDPSLHVRADLARYVTGLRECTNFFVRKGGGISNRAGFQFLGVAGDESAAVNIFKWAFAAADQSTLIEAGDGYFRFYKAGVPVAVTESSVPGYDPSEVYVQGDLVTVSGVIYYATVDGAGDPTDASATDWHALDGTTYEIPTPYAAGAFNSPGPLRLAQSGAIITITHPGYAPMELQNLDTLGDQPRWVLVPVTTVPDIDPPSAGLMGTAGGVGTRTFTYVVTSLSESYEESVASAAIVVATAAVPTEAAPIHLEWTAVAGAAGYRVYLDPFGNNTFGFIGEATGQAEFFDPGFAPDFLRTPPVEQDLFSSSTNYPEMSCFYQQRRVFGYTDSQPDTFWASRTGFRSNFTISSPVQADDAIEATLASDDNNVLRHLIALKRLLVLTETGPVVMRGDSDGTLKPDALRADHEGGDIGASRAKPCKAGNAVCYVHSREHLVFDFRFDGDLEGISINDLTLAAGHLFENRKIKRLEYQQDPHSIVWALTDDGELLGLTYVPAENILAWHLHWTEGTIEDICVVPEDDGDRLYLVVQRTIESQTRRYIERMGRRDGITADNVAERGFFVDAGISYAGTPVSSIDYLQHLEGERVAVVADGVVLANGFETSGGYVVEDGTITLPEAATYIHIGLPIEWPQIETLSMDAEGSNVRGKKKRVQGITAIVDRSTQGFYAGLDYDHLTPQHAPPWEDAGDLVSKGLEMTLTSKWTEDGRFVIRHLQPTPLTILGLMPFIEVGG